MYYCYVVSDIHIYILTTVQNNPTISVTDLLFTFDGSHLHRLFVGFLEIPVKWADSDVNKKKCDCAVEE